MERKRAFTVNRGDNIYLRRPKRLIKATLVALYDYPAARVKVRGEEKIVGVDEVVPLEEYDTTRRTLEVSNARRHYSVAIKRWKTGFTRHQWEPLPESAYCTWHTIRRLKRLGIIA